jgi:2-C-methyl-D-erythritol 4-phosphate cytidylyltransferase
VSEPRVVAIVCAGGSGERLGLAGGKQLALVAGRAVLAWTIEALDATEQIDHIVLVCPASRIDEYRAAAIDSVAPSTPVTYAPSGSSRQASVASGIAASPAGAEILLVHDGARPLVTPEIVAATIAAVENDPLAAGAVVGQPAIDTLKIADGSVITETPDRSKYWAVQTPQTFRAQPLREAYALADADGFVGTDDAAIVEHAGGRVLLVEGPRDNIKVTVAEDVALVEATLAFRASEEG